MHALIYFDTEDYFSPPDHPVHRLPGQLAEIMSRHGLTGCFHIHGEKARFMERHQQTDVIAAVRQHDVSLHYDRGSVHPTTAEECSQLPWFEAVERVLFREVPGFQAVERIFGQCTGITQHGGTFAAQIVYAVGKLGKPFLYSPFRLPERNVVWFCQNLLLGGYQAPFYFDPSYRDTPAFERELAKVDDYVAERVKGYDYTAMFGCHPMYTLLADWPDAVNFAFGATPPPHRWHSAPDAPNADVGTVLANFERLVEKLVAQPGVHWTTVAGIQDLYGQRPVRVSDAVVLAGAEAVIAHGGPTWTPALSAGELLYLLARRVVAPAQTYEVPQVMGPLEDAAETPGPMPQVPVGEVADALVRALLASGYLPARLSATLGGVTPGRALWWLAHHALGHEAPEPDLAQLGPETIPGMAEAIERVRGYRHWICHGPDYRTEGIVGPFRRQGWTLKPAYEPAEYEAGVQVGWHQNPMFDRP